jgi:hypothetical protein
MFDVHEHGAELDDQAGIAIRQRAWERNVGTYLRREKKAQASSHQ